MGDNGRNGALLLLSCATRQLISSTLDNSFLFGSRTGQVPSDAVLLESLGNQSRSTFSKLMGEYLRTGDNGYLHEATLILNAGKRVDEHLNMLRKHTEQQ